MAKEQMTAEQVDDLVQKVDTGGRNPDGALGAFLAGLCFIWSVYQIYISSTVPFILVELTGIKAFVDILPYSRQIHLAFALFLAAMAYPLFASSSRRTVPWYDWILGILGVVACLYMFAFQEELANRSGLPTQTDLINATIGMIVMMIATYRALGLPLLIVASVFLTYVFFGDQPFIPEVVQWKGASYGKAMWHFWMQEEGVFGAALGVSASMVFLFVLFGSLLDKAGAGNWFIKIAFALMGHLRGGPAKAAVVSSAMTGLISGSSIANTVTTGTFTIPLMKRVGFKAEKAGAVEVASSVNGQIMPPVMGAAAFLMVEYVGISYLEVVKHAFVPAAISYIALLYIVHLEALKAQMAGLPKPESGKTIVQKLIGVLTGFLGIAILSMAFYYGLGWTKDVLGDGTIYVVSIVLIAAYVFLVRIASAYPDLELDDPNEPVTELPEARSTAMSGYYYLLPILVLIWCLMVERLSPSLSAFWATMCMIFIMFTQHSLKAYFRGQSREGELARGWAEFKDGMISGARNMIGISVATGAAGIVVGTISLTGAHQVVGDFIEFLSGGSLIAMLGLVAVFSLILGMGLPTTANYIVVSSLMAFVIVEVGAQNGLIVPLIAVHLFVFYFGIMADVTPPVGLASFAAAAVSGGDPIRTGMTAFYYSLRTVALPFLFIFNTDLLLIDVTFLEAIFIFIKATFAMLLFAAGTQGYFMARNKAWEAVALLLIAFTLFRPGFWLDQIQPPFLERPGTEVVATLSEAPPGTEVRVQISGPDFNDPDSMLSNTMMFTIEAGKDAATLLADQGLVLMEGDDRGAVIEEPFFGTPAESLGQQYDFYGDAPVVISLVKVPSDRLPKEIFYLPALALLGLVVLVQRRRQTQPAF
ncbi:MAG: TRAP transporter permease [Alphaproteobacteria bacterium]|nr:TRAP transporter permease [Alphaproteobacteria bacterium]